MSQPSFVMPTRTKNEETLEREGWTRRFTVPPTRLQETVELYESLGYEVHLEPLSLDDLNEQCQDCRAALVFFRVVYTRPKEGGRS